MEGFTCGGGIPQEKSDSTQICRELPEASSIEQRRNFNENPRTKGIVADLFANVPVSLGEFRLTTSSES